jgi:hypothetical protein
VFYDYKDMTTIAQNLRGTFDFLVIDPPFLAEECFTKVAMAASLLRKSKDTPILFCTGIICG